MPKFVSGRNFSGDSVHRKRENDPRRRGVRKGIKQALGESDCFQGRGTDSLVREENPKQCIENGVVFGNQAKGANNDFDRLDCFNITMIYTRETALSCS